VKTGERPLTALAIVVGLAVLREGSEVVLFLYGVLASGSSALSVFLGGMLGVALGVAFTIVTYAGLLVVPTRHIFVVTSALITFLAAGLAAQSVQFLAAAGVVEALSARVWDTSRWLPEDSLVGRLLHTLIGYSDQPSEMQLLVYATVIVAMLILMRVARPAPAENARTVASRA
jgi:high-affinity iron transporter